METIYLELIRELKAALRERETEQKSSCLTTATVQEIQLELVRRRQYNNFDGQQVVADLIAHQE